MKNIAYTFYAAGVAALIYAAYYTITLDRVLGDEFAPAIVLFIAAIASRIVLPKKSTD